MIRVLQIIASLESSGGVQRRLLDNYLNMDRTKIHFDFAVHGYDSGELIPVVESMGSKVFHLTPRKVNLVQNLLQLKAIVEKGEYDIVQSHMEQANGLIMPILKSARVPIRIAHTHLANVPESGWRKAYHGFMSFMINRDATDFWGCSEDAGRWLFNHDRSDFRIIPNAIDVDSFRFDPIKRKQIRRELNIEKNQISIVNVGRFYSQKNHTFLLDIASALKKQGLNFKVYLVGDGDLKEDIVERAKELNVSDKIVFLGIRTDVYNILQAMDVMVHPALFEGLGNVLIEAQASGLPVVASKEGIPHETKLTDLIEFVPLSKDADYWAQRSLVKAQVHRRDTSNLVKLAGYDVKTQGSELQRLYEELIQKVNDKA